MPDSDPRSWIKTVLDEHRKAACGVLTDVSSTAKSTAGEMWRPRMKVRCGKEGRGFSWGPRVGPEGC